MTHRTNESGNALWFILLGVVLLGLLTAMLSRSSGTTEDTGDVERIQISASEVMRFGKSLQNAAQSLISRGCSENTINFDYDTAVTGYENVSSPPDNSCDLFNAKGAGMTWDSAPPDISSSAYIITAANVVTGAECDTANAQCTDLIVLLPGISESTCLQINRMLKVTNPANIPPADNDNAVNTTPFTGSFAFLEDITDAGAVLAGKDAACIATGVGTYAFYYVMLKR